MHSLDSRLLLFAYYYRDFEAQGSSSFYALPPQAEFRVTILLLTRDFRLQEVKAEVEVHSKPGLGKENDSRFYEYTAPRVLVACVLANGTVTYCSASQHSATLGVSPENQNFMLFS
ncbi:hypothetical protein E2C01_002033 [Portunus trituberculatus]|uniref:Uncharacterized protein n=1 Tax=Portunus trituberculatus TaxID=210409 RepID=A0A5B7CKV1_PORTR|nr:hypothetical protein [Portunus trituberculatus]